MPMSKRHFEMVATVVREHGGDQRAELAAAFVAEFRSENAAFNGDLFVTACTDDNYQRRA